MRGVWKNLNTLIFALISFSTIPSYAADDWCLQGRDTPPCSGAPGRCTINKDGTFGGFVADTARVEVSTAIPEGRRNQYSSYPKNRPYIGLRASVCDTARVQGNTRINGSAQVFGDAMVFGAAWVQGNAKVYGRSWVSGNAQIFGNAQVFGDAWIDGNIEVYGEARVFGDSRYQGDGQIFEGDNALVPVNSYVFLPPGPGASIVLPVERPQAAFLSNYAGSWAEGYRAYLDKRHQTYQSSTDLVTILGETFDVNSYDPDDDGFNTAGYTLKSLSLAEALTNALGRKINVGDLLCHRDLNQRARDAISESEVGAYDFNATAFPGASQDSIPLNQEVGDYLVFIRKVIFDEITRLNKSEDADIFYIRFNDIRKRVEERRPEVYPTRYFQNPTCPSTSGIFIHNDRDPIYKITGALFFKIMDAIRGNDERAFIVNMINLATAFHPSKLEARNGFIDAFTFFYVAKEFPNKIIRQRMSHFSLKCGGFY